MKSGDFFLDPELFLLESVEGRRVGHWPLGFFADLGFEPRVSGLECRNVRLVHTHLLFLLGDASKHDASRLSPPVRARPSDVYAGPSKVYSVLR